MADRQILIAGGGIAGVAVALAFARRGRDVRVLEQAPAFEEVGAGLQIGPNALRRLIALGAWDAVAPHAVAPQAIRVRDGLTGAGLAEIALGAGFERRFGAPYQVIHRADLLNGLLEVAAADARITLTSGARVQGFLDHGDAVSVDVAGRGVLKGAALIGADGIHSAVRAGLMGATLPRPSDIVLHRGLLPLAAAPEPLVSVWLHPRAHLVAYPVSGGRRLNVVAATPEGLTPAEAFATATDELRALVASAGGMLAWPALDRPPSRPWSRGRVVLTGDAAHAALPFLAQGAAMALEDAVALAEADSFATFENARFARTARIVADSRAQIGIYHASGAKRLARNVALRAGAGALLLQRMAWIYGG